MLHTVHSIPQCRRLWIAWLYHPIVASGCGGFYCKPCFVASVDRWMGPTVSVCFGASPLVCSAAHLHKRVLPASGHIYEVLLRTLVEYENSAEMGGRGRGLLPPARLSTHL